MRLLPLLLALVAASCAELVPLCDPHLFGYRPDSCRKVEVINSPWERQDLNHCFCRFTIEESVRGMNASFFRVHIHNCDFMEAVSAGYDVGCDRYEVAPEPCALSCNHHH